MQNFISILVFNKIRLTILYSLLPPCFAWNENQENMQSSSVFMALAAWLKPRISRKLRKFTAQFEGRSTRKYTAN